MVHGAWRLAPGTWCTARGMRCMLTLTWDFQCDCFDDMAVDRVEELVKSLGLCAPVSTSTHTHTHTPPPPPHTHTHARARAHTHAHTHTRTHTHTHAHTHTHTHTHAHTWPPVSSMLRSLDHRHTSTIASCPCSLPEEQSDTGAHAFSFFRILCPPPPLSLSLSLSLLPPSLAYTPHELALSLLRLTHPSDKDA